VRWGWILCAAGTAGICAAWALAPATLTPFLAVAAGLLLLWPLWRGGRWLRDAVVDGPQQAWQGRYYEFDGRQVRIFVDDDDALWICAADVLDAVGAQGIARETARVRLAAGRDGLRRAPGSRVLCFTERGLAAWLERRTDARSAAFGRWLTHQVLRPHNRRQELAGIS
jgi:hypothetical protein